MLFPFYMSDIDSYFRLLSRQATRPTPRKLNARQMWKKRGKTRRK